MESITVFSILKACSILFFLTVTLLMSMFLMAELVLAGVDKMNTFDTSAAGCDCGGCDRGSDTRPKTCKKAFPELSLGRAAALTHAAASFVLLATSYWTGMSWSLCIFASWCGFVAIFTACFLVMVFLLRFGNEEENPVPPRDATPPYVTAAR